MRKISTSFSFLLELAAVIDALPEEQKESYNQASSDLKHLFQEEIRSEYGQDLDKVGFFSISWQLLQLSFY